MRTRLLYATALAVLLAAGAVPSAAAESEDAISKTATSGPYQVTLKVLPAESFTGSDAKMARDGGAEAVDLDSPEQPNHHLVVFVNKDGVPVEDATVEIQYRSTEGQSRTWTHEPVARMHEVGKGLATTHYGNNVRLAPGSYEVAVTVNTSPPLTFHFTLPAESQSK